MLLIIFVAVVLLILPHFNKERDLQNACRVLYFDSDKIKITTLHTAMRLRLEYSQIHTFQLPTTLHVTLIDNLESIVYGQVHTIGIKGNYLHIDHQKIVLKNIDKIKVINLL